MNKQQQDKILKEKLQHLQVPFDANAWAQMETLLNSEKKRRGFIFWWVGACSALLLMGGTALYFYNYAEKNIIDANNISNTNNINTTETTTSSEEINTVASQPSTTNKSATIQPENSFHSNTEKNNLSQALNTSANTIQPKEKMNGNGGNNNNNNNYTATYNNSQRNNTAAISNRGSVKMKRNDATENTNANETFIVDAKKNATYNEVLIASFVASIDEIIYEAITMQLIDVKRTEEDKTAIKAPHKKIVHYALGASTMVAATTAGQQASNSFFNKPYYAVGLYHEVLFGKRVAITNGFQYSKNYFEIERPINNFFETQPEKYTCNITMLNIPVGFKINMVAKEKFRWYVHVGINNHIKLKENFEFTVYPTIDTTQPNPSPDPLPTNVSVQTNLSGGSNAQFESQDFATAGGYNRDNTVATTNEFSINNAKRYYVSAYVATGVEYILNNKWHFFVEPTYQFSLSPIGIQERRTHHLGIGIGIRIKF